MKKATTILALPIVEVLEGNTIGKAENIIVNTDSNNIYLVLDGTRAGNISLLNLKDVLGIGDDFILLKSVTSIKKISEHSDLVKELDESFAVIGVPGVSITGNILGKITDFEISDARDSIAGVELDSGLSFDKSQVYTICEKYVFVQEEKPEQPKPEALPETGEPKVVETVPETEEPKVEEALPETEEPKVEEALPETEEPKVEEALPETEEPKVEEAVAEEATKAAAVAEEDAYLVGLTLQDDVIGGDGVFMLNKGTVLTADDVNEARKYNAIVDLATNAE